MISNELIVRVAQRLISGWELEQAVEKGKVMGVLALLQELDKELVAGHGVDGNKPSGETEAAAPQSNAG